MWLYEEKEFDKVPDGIIGFVYKITNTINGKEYIGKKLLSFSKTKQVKGKRKKIRVESDWREYYGSSVELCRDIELNGKEFFIREIIHLCESKGLCNYHEARLQFLFGVLEHPEKYYNQQIRVRVHRSHLKLKKLDV